jgi:hypothetical protein
MKKFTEENPNLLGLGLSRRWEGALIGILSVLAVSLLCWGAGYTPFVLIIFGVSSILPAALFGSLIISKKMIQRTFGISLLVMYIALWIFFSLYLVILMG